MHQGQLRSKALKDIVARRAGALSQHQHDLKQHISQVGFCKEEQTSYETHCLCGEPKNKHFKQVSHIFSEVTNPKTN